jgi:hypothetical protein
MDASLESTSAQHLDPWLVFLLVAVVIGLIGGALNYFFGDDTHLGWENKDKDDDGKPKR